VNQEPWDYDENSQVYKSQPLDLKTAKDLLEELMTGPLGQHFNPRRTNIHESSTKGKFKVVTRSDYLLINCDLELSYEAKNPTSNSPPPVSALAVSIFKPSETKPITEDEKYLGMKPPAH
jgi:hypothetical protein